MAKITITLEDRRDNNGNPVVSLDMTGAPSSPFSEVAPTVAVRLSKILFGLATCEEALGNQPACRRQPSNNTIH